MMISNFLIVLAGAGLLLVVSRRHRAQCRVLKQKAACAECLVKIMNSALADNRKTIRKLKEELGCQRFLTFIAEDFERDAVEDRKDVERECARLRNLLAWETSRKGKP